MKRRTFLAGLLSSSLIPKPVLPAPMVKGFDLAGGKDKSVLMIWHATPDPRVRANYKHAFDSIQFDIVDVYPPHSIKGKRADVILIDDPKNLPSG